MTRHSGRAWFIAVSLYCGVALQTECGAVELLPGAPERYTIQDGDTLWGIANRYLRHPWEWQELWRANPHIEDPEKLYPGDVLILSGEGDTAGVRVLRSQKLDTVRLTPVAYATSSREAIPTVPPSAVLPFLAAPLVVEQGMIDSSPHVMAGFDDRTILGNLDKFYARGLSNPTVELYDIYRIGDAFLDPDTREPLGQEAIFLGEARLLEFGEEISKLEIVAAREEIRPADRLLPSERGILVATFHPRRPDADLRGRIIRVYGGDDPWAPQSTLRGEDLARRISGSLVEKALGGVRELGTFSVAALSLGARDGLEPGHVLRVRRFVGERPDPVDGRFYELPADDSGLLLVFRTFEKVSYGLVVNATRSFNVLDVVETP